MSIQISFQKATPSASIQLPGSKSESNRMLMLRALSGFSIPIMGLSSARDTVILEELLAKVNAGSSEFIELDCHDGGAPLRFLMAICALLPGEYRLTGTKRLMERPQADLIHSLRAAGAEIRSLGNNESGPWEIIGGKMKESYWTVSTDRSSQYASALLLIAPFFGKPVQIKFSGNLISRPYLDMTLDALRLFGVDFKMNGYESIAIQPGFIKPKELNIAADWSSAAFFLAAAASMGLQELRFPGLRLNSSQGDAFIEKVFRYEGWFATEEDEGLLFRYTEPSWNRNSMSLNLQNYPDLSPPLVIYYLLAGRNVDFYGLESLADKESMRDLALGEAVQSCGAKWQHNDNVWSLGGSITHAPSALKTHNDHRLAMAFSLLSIPFQHIDIEEHASVAKSFPDFWNQIDKLGIRLYAGI